MIAHAIFAIFLSDNGTESLAFLMSGTGIAMLAVGSAVGACLALGFYAVTVVSLPMLVDRDVDFMTAIIASLSAFRANRRVLLGWAVLIAAALFTAMLPAFLGLLVVLPVLGHATWHLYRRLLTQGQHPGSWPWSSPASRRQDSITAGSMLPPDSVAITVLPFTSTRPASSAASVTAPPGSTTSFSSRKANATARATSASLTATPVAPWCTSVAKVISAITSVCNASQRVGPGCSTGRMRPAARLRQTSS
jgi:hypothetical protein